jgi:hypothetical protein
VARHSSSRRFAMTVLRQTDFVDKIPKGATPGELPSERSTIFELVVTMKTGSSR